MFVRPGLIDPKKHTTLFADLPAEKRDAARLKVFDIARHDLLPDEGREVSDHLYWHQRLRDGDVVACTTAEIAALKAAGVSKDTPKSAAKPSRAAAAE